MLDLRFNEIVNGEVFRDSKGVEPVGSDAPIEVGGVGKPREGLGFGTGLEAGGGTALCDQEIANVRHELQNKIPQRRLDKMNY